MGNSRYKDIEPTDFENISTYELASRPSKVNTSHFAAPIADEPSLDSFLESLPDVLGVQSLRAIAERIVRAKHRQKPIIWGFGGHVIKTGLAPVLNDLMGRGFLTAIACNGSVLVHDSEIAMVGFTSEDVDASLGEGDFGAAKETGELLNAAAAICVRDDIGLGEAACLTLSETETPFAEFSVLLTAFRRKIPVTVHVTIGADIGHFHPTADGAAIGYGSHRDFKLFTSIVREMDGGGVYLNFGSAVTMPEIFLKAVTVNRNLGHRLQDITTANFDFIQHYRPLSNVVRRPTANGAGKGYAITGHHEFMLPLLAAQISKISRG